MRPRVAAFDIFCGCGGLTRGLLDAGIAVLVGVDSDEKVRKTYEGNNRTPKFLHLDVKETHGSHLLRYFAPDKWEYLVLAGCAPCQPFSPMKRGRTKRGQAQLLMEFGRLAGEIMPDVILLENVPGLKGKRGRTVWDSFVRHLTGLGFIVNEGVVDAKDYGVPQTRKRLLLMAGHGFSVNMPPPTHGPSGSVARKYETVKNAIAHYPRLAAGQSSLKIKNHIAPSLEPVNLDRIRLIPKDGGSRSALPQRYVLDCHSQNGLCHSDTYGRMKWNRPAPTLTGKCTGLSNGRFGHPSQNRAISVREAAALQTFPDSYVFPKGIMYPTKLIGNAVPVRLAKVIGARIAERLAGVYAAELRALMHSGTPYQKPVQLCFPY